LGGGRVILTKVWSEKIFFHENPIEVRRFEGNCKKYYLLLLPRLRFFYIAHLKTPVLRQEPFIYDAFVSYSEEQGIGTRAQETFSYYVISPKGFYVQSRTNKRNLRKNY
jgi:hypothetical protein